MSNPFFTLITPVYNIEKLISATINSALEQTFTDWEMICVDDGSPDNAGAICDSFAERDERIRVIHKKNAGLASARNTGLDEARGKYFIILEGSDLFFDEFTLENIYSDLTQNPVDMYFGLLQDKMENTGEVTNVQAEYCVDGLWTKGGEALVCKLYDNEDILALSSPVNKVFRTEFVLNNNLRFYEGIYHDDDEWIPRAIAHTESAFFTKRIIYNALTWDGCFGGNVSDKGLTKKAVDKMLLAENCCKYFEEHFGNNSELQMKMNTYYIRMYQEGLLAYYRVSDAECKEQIMKSAKEHEGIFKYFKNCDSRNIKLLGLVHSVAGLKNVMKLIQRRYS